MIGGKTARMISPARLIGTRDGTGAQVSTKTHTRAHACTHRPVGAYRFTVLYVTTEDKFTFANTFTRLSYRKNKHAHSTMHSLTNTHTELLFLLAAR